MNEHSHETARIAVPTNDGVTIFPGMLGMAKYMHIYTSDDVGIRYVEERENPYSETMQHLKTLDVYNVLKDCSTIISGTIGKKGIERLREKGVQLYFRNGNIHDALEDIYGKE